MERVVVVGGSLSGLRAAQSLRREDVRAEIVVVDADVDVPYDRPPLSKAYLVGDDPAQAVRPPLAGVDDLGLTWRRGRRAVALDVEARRVTLDDGEALEGDAVLLACGAVPRLLPGTDEVAGVHVLRTLADARALRADLDGPARRVVVIGAGFIGAEVAASARSRGHDVTVVEALELPLARVLPRPLAERCAALHTEAGVVLRLGVGVDHVQVGSDERVTGIAIADGSTIDADVVVVGIGVVPATAWLESSGLTLEDGVVCDEALRAAPGIVAAGDVARWPSRRAGGLVRIEHWENAVEMGIHAARTLVADARGEPGEPYDPVPWFWSDQYGRKIQLAGRCGPDDVVQVVSEDPERGRVVAIIGRGGQLVGVFGVNRPADVNRWRERIADGTSWSDAMALADQA